MEKIKVDEGEIIIGTPSEAWWTEIKKSAEKNILNAENGLILEKRTLDTANEMIAKEQNK